MPARPRGSIKLLPRFSQVQFSQLPFRQLTISRRLPNNARHSDAVYQVPSNPLRNAPNVYGGYPAANYPQPNDPQNGYSQPAVYQQPAGGTGPAKCQVVLSLGAVEQYSYSVTQYSV